MDYVRIGLIAAAAIVAIIIYVFFGDKLRESARRRSRTRTEQGPGYSRFGEEERLQNNPYIPDFIEMHPGRSLGLFLVLLLCIVTVMNAFVTVPAGHRGVLITFGKVEIKIYDEGAGWKLPYVQKIEYMSVQIQKAESTESAASHDLQDVTTTVAVNYRLIPQEVDTVYQELRHDYTDRVIKPNIEESLKAATAMYTAEELITKRAMMKDTFFEILADRLETFGVDVVAVSLTDFKFSDSFSAAIEAKVTAEQEALEAKNKLEQVRHEAQQQIIQAEAEKNATIARALGDAEAVRISKDAEAYGIELHANATAAAIAVITEQMTSEYAQYLHLLQWDGKYPTTMLGSLEDLGVIIDTTP